MPGDTIRAEVYAKYVDFDDNNWQAALQTLMGYLGSPGTAPPGTIVDGSGYVNSNTTPLGITPLGHGSDDENGVPKAYLNYIFINRNFDISSLRVSYKRITQAGKEDGSDGPHDYLTLGDTIEEAGYVYVYLSNDGEEEREVYFDDFSVQHIKSPVIESSDYYPFGLTYNNYSRENSLANQIKFQGQEHQDELDLGWDAFKWRNHQPDIGRFFNVDPLSEKFYYNSPYAFSENKVTNHIELEGLEAVPAGLGGALIAVVRNYLFGDGNDGSERSAAEFGRAQEQGSALSQRNQENLQNLQESVDQIPVLNVAGSISSAQQAETTGETLEHLGRATLHATEIPIVGSSPGGKATVLPNETPVVRGGTCKCSQFENGSGVTVVEGKLNGVSVNSNTGLTVEQLSTGIPNKQMGVTTVGQVRQLGGDVVSSPTANNPNHSTLSGITGPQAEQLFNVIPNPSTWKKK